MTYASQSDNQIRLNWWNFPLFICLCGKKDRFCVRIYFLFSVQFIAAVHPFMSNHRYLYPHIPKPCSYSEPVAVCFMTALKLYLTSQYVFTVQADQQVCIALQNQLSLFLSRSLSSCVRCIIPLSCCLSQFLYYCLSLSFSHSLSLTSQEASDVFTDVLTWLLSQLILCCSLCNCFALLLSFQLSFLGSNAAAHFCFCVKGLFLGVFLCKCCSPHSSCPLDMAA